METTTKKIQAVYTVVSKNDGKEVWLRLGSAFPNRDGSLTVLLDAVPTNGRLQIREYTPRDVAAAPRREAVQAQAQAQAEAGAV
jgi:hypothetical protein